MAESPTNTSGFAPRPSKTSLSARNARPSLKCGSSLGSLASSLDSDSASPWSLPQLGQLLLASGLPFFRTALPYECLAEAPGKSSHLPLGECEPMRLQHEFSGSQCWTPGIF